MPHCVLTTLLLINYTPHHHLSVMAQNGVPTRGSKTLKKFQWGEQSLYLMAQNPVEWNKNANFYHLLERLHFLLEKQSFEIIIGVI